LNSGRIVLPRNDRLQGQIVGLERRTSAVGRDTISHPDRHDDVANAVAGAAALSKFGGYDTSLLWASGDDDDNRAAWQRVRLQASVNSVSIGTGMGPLISIQKGPFDRRVLLVALAASQLAGVAETTRARVI
jgi:hypothetical protein